MQLDPKTLIISISATLTLMAIPLASMRKGLAGTIEGVGHLALANVFGAVATLFLGLRGVIPYWLSFIAGNGFLFASLAFYTGACSGLSSRVFPQHAARNASVAAMAYAAAALWLCPDRWLGPAINIPLASGAFYCFFILFWRQSFKGIFGFNRFLASGGMFFFAFFCSVRAFLTLTATDQNLYSPQLAWALLATMASEALFTLGMMLMFFDAIQVRLTHLASRDFLTGALNRRSFMEAAEAVRKQPKPSEMDYAILFDLDHFKSVNDNHGHPAGDEILRGFCSIAMGLLPAGSIFGRYGGEEFSALVTHCSETQAAKICEQIVDACRENLGESIGTRCTVSVGAAPAKPGQSLERALKQADEALYESKRSGRDRFTLFK